MAKKQAAAKPAASETLIGEVLGASPDELQTNEHGSAIREFLRGAAGFFTTARTMEQSAQATLVKARTLVLPTNGDEDAAIQIFIKRANTDRKAIEEHWSITSTISKFHKMLVAGRTRGTDPLEQAATIAQQLHNRYAEDERRRAAAEQDRLRREAEERAKAERDRELAEAERKALEAEASSPALSTREETFVLQVVAGRDPITAARIAGYKDPSTQGPRLMTYSKVLDAIAAKRQAAEVRQQAEAIRNQPLNIEPEKVRPDIRRGGGAIDRTTHSGEVIDEAAFIAAVIAGKHGIPWDVLTVNETKLNEYARSLQERLNLWPGVRHNKKTKTI